jgi:23S rRNA (adenine2503-C2)-methyltransferase
MTDQRPRLLELTFDELEDAIVAMGQKPFRAKQLAQWVYQKNVTDPDAMSNVPNALVEGFDILTSHVIERADSEDGTVKLLLALEDGQTIECVAMPTTKRVTACLSTQVGCGMGCRFCASGADGLIRNLRSGEILEQIIHLSRAVGRRVSNVVLMGMGEPLANFKPTLDAIYGMIDPDRFDLGGRHITLSTVGIPHQILRLADEALPITLAISLHAPNDTLRRQIIPSAQETTIIQILKAARVFYQARKREVTLEYVVLAGLNDTDVCADELAKLAYPMRCNVNLIAYNAQPDDEFRSPTQVEVKAFARQLEKRGVNVTIRKSRGVDITAACGQLRQQHQRDKR